MIGDKAKIAVLLSGCGVKDGAEIHEATCALLAIKQLGADYVCFAPNKPLYHVIDHIKGAPTKEVRNVMVEAARIARGEIHDLAEFRVADYDAIVIPGGFGSAKNLSDYAFKGRDAKPDETVATVVRAMQAAGKPIGAICISPALIASIFRGTSTSPTLTIGSDPSTAADIEAMGSKHIECPATNCYVDEENKIVSTPAYMSAAHIDEVYDGIRRLVEEVIKLA
ncbi:isoprenoid biosynthesis glyoxalase ElbB [bacterium]|nr:isoprenoid biosynthesis glyoxalase ElbB [bacterium]